MYHGYSFFPLTPGMKLVLLLAIVWTAIWKGIALWRSGRNGQKAWFVVLFIFNTLGILDIIYLLAFSHTHKKQPSADSQE